MPAAQSKIGALKISRPHIYGSVKVDKISKADQHVLEESHRLSPAGATLGTLVTLVTYFSEDTTSLGQQPRASTRVNDLIPWNKPQQKHCNSCAKSISWSSQAAEARVSMLLRRSFGMAVDSQLEPIRQGDWVPDLRKLPRGWGSCAGLMCDYATPIKSLWVPLPLHGIYVASCLECSPQLRFEGFGRGRLLAAIAYSKQKTLYWKIFPVCLFWFQVFKFKCWQDLNAMGLKLGLWVEPEMVNQDREGHVMKNRHTAHCLHILFHPQSAHCSLIPVSLTHTWWNDRTVSSTSNIQNGRGAMRFSRCTFVCKWCVKRCIVCCLSLRWFLLCFVPSLLLFVDVCGMFIDSWVLPSVLYFAKVLHHPARMRSEGRSRSPWKCWSVKWMSSQPFSTNQKVGHSCPLCRRIWFCLWIVEPTSTLVRVLWVTLTLVKRCNYEPKGSYLKMGIAVLLPWTIQCAEQPLEIQCSDLPRHASRGTSWFWILHVKKYRTLRVIEFYERGFSRFWRFHGTRSTFCFGCAGASQLESLQSKIWNYES